MINAIRVVNVDISNMLAMVGVRLRGNRVGLGGRMGAESHGFVVHAQRVRICRVKGQNMLHTAGRLLDVEHVG